MPMFVCMFLRIICLCLYGLKLWCVWHVVLCLFSYVCVRVCVCVFVHAHVSVCVFVCAGVVSVM